MAHAVTVQRVLGSRTQHQDTASDRDRRIARMVRLARLFDSSITIPGTRFTLGIDPLIGLIPGIGDVLSAAVSVYIIHEAHQLGASRTIVARMALNVAIDLLIGEIPILGDVFDFAFKANVRNLRLMGIEI